MNNTNTIILKLDAFLQALGYDFEALFYGRLAGPDKKNLRQAAMFILTGKKIPLSECGVNRIYGLLVGQYGPSSWSCENDRINKTIATMRGYLQP
jgi:hypothetical protein